MAQIYTNDIAFTRVYPMRLKSQAHETLSAFIHEVGIPSSLHSDDAKELMEGKFKDLCKDLHIPCTYTEPFSPWQNRAENAIRELKRHVRRIMIASRVPSRLGTFVSNGQVMLGIEPQVLDLYSMAGHHMKQPWGILPTFHP